jgi:hypothetical protein
VISGQRVLRVAFMASVAYVASPISRLVRLKVVEALRPVLRQWSSVTVMRIVAVVDRSVKAVRAVKPGACSNKQPARKPIRPIVAVRSAVVRGVVEIAVRTLRSHSDVYANGNLSRRPRCRPQKTSYENCQNQRTDFEHDISFLIQRFKTGQLRGSIIPGSVTGNPEVAVNGCK